MSDFENLKGYLDDYIRADSEEYIEMKEYGRVIHEQAKTLSKEKMIENKARFFANLWHQEHNKHKEQIVKLLESKCPNELDKLLPLVSECLLARGMGFIKDNILDELADYVLLAQITGTVPFSLNLMEPNNKKPAHRPKLNNKIYINTLMVYFETGSISETAQRLKKDRTTIKYHLKKIVGDEYGSIHNEAHPLYKKISMAYDIWKLKQK